MWQLTKEIAIRMDLIWRTLAVVLVLLAPELNAVSSSSVLSGFASSVLPSISSNTLYPSIQNLTSSTNGGFATVERSTKLANNATSAAQLPSIATLSLSSISSILKTETSVLSISETRTIINHTTTVPLGSSQSVSASQTSIEVVMSTVSSNYSLNTSSVPSVDQKKSSTVMVLSAIRTLTASSLQTSVMSPSVQQGSVSANMTHLTPVLSLTANLSGFVSATRTLSLTQSSSALAKATPSQSHLSLTVTINNGSSTGSPSQSMAGTLTSSSSVDMATNRTLSISYLPSSMVINASKTAIENPSTVGVSASISASTSGKSIFESKVPSANETVAMKSTPVLVTVNSSVHAVNATATTVLTSKATIHVSPTHSADISTIQSRSSAVKSTLQASTVLSSVGMAVNQTRSVAVASSPSRSIPSLNQTVSAVKTSALLPSTRVPLNTSLVPTSSSVGVGEPSSLVASQNATSLKSTSTPMSIPVGLSSSLGASKNATTESSTSVSLHPSTVHVAAPSSTASIGVVSSIAKEKPSSVSSPVVMSSRLPLSTSVPLHTLPVATSSSVKVDVISSMATATVEGPSSTPLVVSSRSRNVTSQSRLSSRLTPSSKTAALPRSSVETVTSPAASVTPNKTSTDEGFIVTSYSTPCYIYYVVEKTVFPVSTANHSAVPSTTPKITLDIGSATRLHSGLPTVTLTHTVAMTTQVSKAQSQMLGSTDAITSSTGLVEESVKSSMLIAPTSTSTHLLSKTSILPSETVTEVLGTDTGTVVQTDSATVPSVMRPSVSSSVTSDSRNTTDTSTFQTGILSTQIQSIPSQSGTLAIPRVTTSVMGLQSTTMTNKTLGSSSTILPGSFTPVVANASVSETHNMSTTIPTGALTSTKQESFQSTHGSSSIMFTSSVGSRMFVPTVAPSLPSQNVSSAATVSGVSQVMSSDAAPVTTQASDGSVFPSNSGSIVQATDSSEIPTTAIFESQLVTEMSNTKLVTSSERQVTSSPARHTSVIESSPVLLMNTTRLSQMPSPTSSGNLLSVAANETTAKSISSPPVLLSSLATVSQNRTLSTVSLSAIGSSKNSSSVGSVEQISSLAQSSSMIHPVASSSSVQMLPSSDTRASPSTSSVMETLSTVMSNVIAMSTQVTSRPQLAASSSPAGNRTSASSIEMIPSSAGIHPPSNTSSSVGEPLSSVKLSQVGTASTPTGNNTQVAPSSSLSQAGNTTSASSTEMLPSSSMYLLPSVITSIAEPLSSAMLPLSTTVSQAGGMSILVSSSLQVAVSSSFSQADNKSSATVPLQSSSSSLEALPPLRRKKRAVGDPSSATSVIEFSSSAGLTSSVGKTVISTIQHSSAVILPSSLVASQTLQISNSVMPSAVGGGSHDLVPTSTLGSSGQSLNVSESLSSRSVSVSVNSSNQAASSSLSEGNVNETAALPSGSPSTSSASEQNPASNTTSSSLSVAVTIGSATSSIHLSPSQHANVTESHFGSITRSPITSTDVVPSTQVSLPNTSVPSREQSSSVGVVVSSTFVGNVSSFDLQPSTSAVLGNSSSTLTHSVTSVSSSVQGSSVGVVDSSTIVDNETLPSTSPLGQTPSASAVLINRTSTMAHSVTTSSVQDSSVGVVISSTFVDNGTLPSTSSLGNSTSTLAHSVPIVSSSVQSSSLGVVVSSAFVGNDTLPSTSSLSNSTLTSAHSVPIVSSSVQSSSLDVVASSAFVGNDTLPLTSSLELKSSPSTLLSNSTSTLAHSVKSVSSSIQSTSTFVDNSTLPSTSSLELMMSSVVLDKSKSILAHSTTGISQPSTVFGNASVIVSSSSLSPGKRSSFVVVVPTPSSVSLGRDSSSLTQQPLESSVIISSSPLPTKITNFSLSSAASSSPLANMSVTSTALQSASDTPSLSIPPSSAHLSSPTTDRTSQAVSRSVVTRLSTSAVESSEILQTIVSSSVTVAASSRIYRPPLVTISSLGICYVVYTTRIVQPSLVSTQPVNMSSTASVNVSSTRGFSVVMNTTSIHVSPSVSLNTSSAVVQVNATHSQSSRVISTAVHVNFTVKPSGSSSSVQISSTVPLVNSTTSLPVSPSSAAKSVEVTQSSNVSQSTSSASSSTSQIISVALTTLPSVKETSSLAASTYLLSKTPSISTTEVLSSSQAPTSQVISPSRTVSQVVSSSTTVPPTQPPDSSLLVETVLAVPKETDVQSEGFKNELEGRLAEAYRFAEVTVRRRRRATPGINATIDSIQRVDNGEDVNVTFFITKDGQNVPASDAVQNYQKLSKAQLGNLIKYDVVSMPQALVVPPTPSLPPNILVSLIIKASASGNISVPENKKKLEDKLAAYYMEKKQLTAPTVVTASIKTIIHEPNEIDYLEFYISVSGQAVNASDVVQTFKVPHVNLLTAQLGVQVLVQAYIPDSLTATEADYVIIGMSVPESQVLTSASFRSDLGDKLVTVYQKGKGKKNSRRKKRSGSTSATIKEIARKPGSTASEADVTFFVFDAGKVMNASYVVSVMNRLSTSEMTTFTSPYAILSAPKRAIVPTVTTEVTPTVAATPIKWWIIPAVICPILLIIIIILLVCWRWKKGAPKSKVEPDTIRMLETDKRKPVHGFDVARYTEPGVSGMKTTAFMARSPASVDEDEEAAVKPVTRETSLRRKVAKRPIHKPPAREQRQTKLNHAYEEEEEEEDDESVVSVTPTGSTQGLMRGRTPAKPPSATRKTPAKPQRPVEPSEMDSEEDSELSEGESESEPESVAQPEQTRHSAAQVPTVAVMSEASGPPRYPPVRFRSSVHPAPSLPPLNAKQTSLVGVKVEPPSEDDSTRGRRRKGKVTKRELEQRADLERQKNKQRLRDRKRNASYSPGVAVPAERKAWDRAQPDIDDVLEEEEAERVITGKKRKPRRRRPPSSSVATDEEGVPHLKSYRKLKSPNTTSSVSTRGRDKKRGKSTDSVSNASSDESEIDMNETRRRMHTMLDDAFSLFGPQFSKKFGIDPEGQPAHPEAHPEAYPATPARPAVIPRYIGGQPALPEPPPAHGRATEPTARQRRRVQPTMPGYPAGMPQTPIGMPGYPGRTPVRPPIVTRDPIVVWDPADRQRILNQRAPPPTYAYRDPSGQNVYITPVQQQRDDMGGLVWSPYAAEDSMDALYPDLAQASYPGALGTSPPKDTSFLSHLQAAPPHDTVLNMSANSTLDQRGASLGQSPQPLIKSIKDELFRLSQGASRKTPITEL